VSVYRRDQTFGVRLALLPPVTVRVPAETAWAHRLAKGEWVEAAGEVVWLSRSVRNVTVIQAGVVQLAWGRQPRLIWCIHGTVDEVVLSPGGSMILISYDHRGRRDQKDCKTQIETALRAASIGGPAVLEGTVTVGPDMSIQYILNSIQEVTQ
jgi:hypothetical protein